MSLFSRKPKPKQIAVNPAIAQRDDVVAILTQTVVPDEQVQRLNALAQAAAAPVYTLTVTLDGRRGTVHIGSIGAAVPVDAALAMLDDARSALVAQAEQAKEEGDARH